MSKSLFRFSNLLCFILLISEGVFAQSYKQLSKDFDTARYTGKTEEAYKVGGQILQKYSKEIKKDPMLNAAIYNTYGNYFFINRNLDTSLAYYTKAVNMVYGVKIDTCLEYALYIQNAAEVAADIGYYDMADKYFAVSLPRLAKYLGASSRDYTDFYSAYVDLKVDMGDYANAEPMNNSLIYYYKTLDGETGAKYLACVSNKARVMQGQGRYEEALPIFHQMVDDSRKYLIGDTLTLAVSLNNLAYCYRLMGKNSDALTYFLEAYRLQNLCKKTPDSERASILNNLAIVYKANCDYENAEKCFLKSIELYQKAGMQMNVEIANPCNNLGDMYRILGNYKEAYNYLNYSLEIRRNTSGEKHEYYANALNNIGLLYLESGMYDDAEIIFTRCEEIYKEALGEENDRYSYIVNQLATLYAGKKEYSKALVYKAKALRLMEKTIGKQNDRYGLFLSGKGMIEYRMKEYKQAINSFTEAADIFKNNFGAQNFNYIDMVHNLAITSDDAGDHLNARKNHLIAINGYKKIVKDNLSFMSDEEKTNFYFSTSGRYENFEHFVIKSGVKGKGEVDDTLLRALIDERLWSKSILLNESGALYKNMLNAKDTSIKRQFAEWYQQKKNLHSIYQLSKDELKNYNINVEDEEMYLINIEKQLASKSKEFSQDRESMNFEKLKTKLNKNELAVDIVRNEYWLNDSVNEITYAAVIIGKDYKTPKMVVLDSSAAFDSLFYERYKFDIHAKTTDKHSYNRFFAPLEKFLPGITKIYFSPDGVYQKMNLYTLFNPKTNKYLIETLEIEQVTSLNDLQKEMTSDKAEMVATLFGYPDYEMNPVNPEEKKELVATRFGFSELPELPGTKVETEMISSVFKTKNWNTKLYLGRDATEEQVKATENPTILHIATHGFFLPDLDYSDEKILGFDTETARRNPLLRSGVIMAGAASKDTVIEKKEDGILTAYEASLLNLQNTELVTLSACETGLGDQLMNGQGVYGLQRAFLTAGAKSVLMSLWVVDDYATQELMTNFYGEWLKDYETTNKRSSFRKAQLEVKKRYPAPYYWGAFVMIGK